MRLLLTLLLPLALAAPALEALGPAGDCPGMDRATSERAADGEDMSCCATGAASMPCCRGPAAPGRDPVTPVLAPCPCGTPGAALDPLLLVEVGPRTDQRARLAARTPATLPPAATTRAPAAPTRCARTSERDPPGLARASGSACAMGRGRTRGAPGLLAALSISRS